MKNFEKLLQLSKKLEDRQTVRKAKEVDEIEKFDSQEECHKCRELDQMLKINDAHAQLLKQELEKPVAAQQEWLKEKTEELSEVEEFEKQAQDLQINAPGNEFEMIEEIQGNTFEEKSYQLKQLPPGSPDTFAHDLSDLTETQLQREFDWNKAAISGEQDFNEEEEAENLFFFRQQLPRQK